MSAIEDAFKNLDLTNRILMEKRLRGEKVTKEEQEILKKMMKDIHIASKDVEIEAIADLLKRYDIGMGMAHIEPNYERINHAFAWLEAQDSSIVAGSVEDGDLEDDDDQESQDDDDELDEEVK